jgi:hypothetical protein
MRNVTSGERDAIIIADVNTIGNHVSAMLIFPWVHCKYHMLTGAPKASIGGANPTGLSNEKLSVYHKHFMTYGKPSKEDQLDVRQS